MITVESVSKSFDGRRVVDQISFQAREREILVLLGPSGCGKTTTLKMINRLIEPESGRIFIDGKDIRDQKAETFRMGIGFVMQNSGLFPHYTVSQNIAIVPDLLKWDKRVTKSKTADLMHKLHLPEDLLFRFPKELSGGQQQRVGIARALIANTPVLLMDEPFGALDNITKLDIHSDFKSLEELRSKTIVMVTHDVQEAFELGHRICVIDKGKIVQIGTPEDILYRPENEFVRSFFSENGLLLEYKIATLKDVQPFLTHSQELIIQTGVPHSSSVWNALQLFSADIKYADSYEKLTRAFSEYRKLKAR